VSEYTLEEIARAVGGEVRGDPGRRVCGVCDVDAEDPRRLAVVWERKRLDRLSPSQPLLTFPSLASDRDAVLCPDPRRALVPLLALWRNPYSPPVGIHPTAVVDSSATVDATAAVGPGCVVCAGARIGADAVLVAHVFVGPRAEIGRGTRLEPGVVVGEETLLGERCIVRSGSVLGADGFGYLEDEAGHRVPIPQIGRVVLEDRVEVGALTAIDRATFGETRIGEGTKIDNLVQIGHNCRFGRNCVVVGMSGVSGSVRVGDGAVLAARASVRDHVTIGERALVAGNAGVTKDVPPGRIVSGFPARDHREELRLEALRARLPELYARLRELEAEVAALRGKEGGGA
jgi:UDP-3-O-[3-hydroxymyristoyl] glucosamine N-acyltransferase